MQAKITNEGKNGWRVDLPNGDYCYQPSEQFAKAYAAQWQQAGHDATTPKGWSLAG